MDADLVAGDTGTTLAVTCKDKDTKSIINLTGKTAKLRYKIGSGSLQVKTMTVTDAAGGVAEYLFLTGELIAGLMTAEVQIIDSLSREITQIDPFEIMIRKRLS